MRRLSTVRSRFVGTVIGLVALTLAVVGTMTYILERREIDERLDTDLRIATEQFAALASESFETGSYTSLDKLLGDSLSHTVPRENEGAVGFVGTKPTWTQPGGLDMAEDQEMMTFLKERVSALSGRNGEIERQTTAETTYMYAILPLSFGDLGEGAYVVAFDFDEEVEGLNDTVRLFALASLACLLVLALSSWLIAGRLLAPVRQLTKTAEQISTSDLNSRLEIDADDELGKMASTFNSMLDRLQGAFASQMTLLDDAGHELRTPITIIRGHLELMDTNDPADVIQVRDLAVDELDRMHRLADDLVLLAKAKRPDFVTKKPVDVAPFIDKVAELGRALGPQNIIVDARPEAICDMDGQRMTQAMVQLIANASKFSPADSTIRIGARLTSTRVEMWVADSGPGIPPDKIETIFQRFGRLDPSVEGTGLGLTIVAAIADGHGGSVNVDSKLGSGTTMTLSIPVEDTWPTS